MPRVRARRVKESAPAVAVLSIILAMWSCAPQTQQRTLSSPQDVLRLDSLSPPFLKAHMRGGDAVIFSDWKVDDARRLVSGRSVRYDLNRLRTDSGVLSISIDSAVLFEANRLQNNALVAMTIVTGASLGVTGYCIANPKACFGSCPTFYVETDSTWRLEAEGFSSSLLPSLEETDIDALPSARARNGRVTIQMRNEALETHNVRSATLLAVPHAANEQVYAADRGDFWRSTVTRAPVTCQDASGSCLAALGSMGVLERSSLADSFDLATREHIDLEFPAIDAERVGLVLRARQSLLSTFLLYEGLSYLGTSAGDWLAAAERGNWVVRWKSKAPFELLGGIEVQQRDAGGQWQTVAQLKEQGPIALDMRVLPLPGAARGPLSIRLRLTRGAWRVDYVALASLNERVTPLRLEPEQLSRDGRVDLVAAATLRDTTRFLTTLPGDVYTLTYRVPKGSKRLALFMESRGYYLEWMRDAWLAGENPGRAALLFSDPVKAMRVLAPEFKLLEPSMEEAFWRSRYVPR